MFGNREEVYLLHGFNIDYYRKEVRTMEDFVKNYLPWVYKILKAVAKLLGVLTENEASGIVDALADIAAAAGEDAVEGE